MAPTSSSDLYRLDWWNCDFKGGMLEKVLRLDEYLVRWTWAPSSGIFGEKAGDLPLVVVYALALTAIRLVSKHYLLPPLGRWLGIKSKRRSEKFCYQFWLATYYTISTSVGLYFMYTENSGVGLPWSCKAATTMWGNYPDQGKSRLFNTYYLIQAAFYLQEFAATILESRLADFWVYLWHHFCTFVLISGSYSSLDHEFGQLIMLAHDIPDIFLSWAKVCHYARKEVISHVFFVGLALSFGFFRLYLFPGLIHSAWSEGLEVREDTVYNGINLMFLTFGLLPLHWMWYYLILRVAYRAIFCRLADIRSDSDSDGDDKKKKA